MWQAAAISSPPPTTAPCSTATTGALPNSMRSNARCQLREWAIPCAISREVSSVRSRPAQKCSPSPASTTALIASGRAAKKVSIPNTVGSSMAFRFSGRARKRTAMSPRRSALSERGSSMSKPLADLLTAILAALKSRVRSVTFLRKPVKRSHHLIDVEPDRELLARAGSERQNPVEPGERRVGSLEPHHGAEVIARRRNRLASGERGDHLGRAVAQPVAAYEHPRAPIGLDRVARLKIGDPVRPHDLPIRAGQN